MKTHSINIYYTHREIHINMYVCTHVCVYFYIYVFLGNVKEQVLNGAESENVSVPPRHTH